MQNWFKEWFGSEEYLNVYNHRDDEDAEIFLNSILKRIEIPERAEVLDAACGAGRHSIMLAKKGFSVTAFDLSEGLLKVARNRAMEENLDIDFIHSDIRSFSSQKTFDLVLNIFTSFGYFESDEENFSFFDKLNDLLKDGGYFVFDFLNKNFVEENLIPSSDKWINGKHISENRKIENGRVVKKITIESGSETNDYFESVKLYSSIEIINRLKENKLNIVEVLGNYEGDSYNEYESERLIILAKK